MVERAAASRRGRDAPWSRSHALTIAAALVAICGWVYLREPLAPIDRFFLDVSLATVVAAEGTDRVVLVAIDDRSLAELGRWPWSRDRQAELIASLEDAAAVGYVIAPTEPSSSRQADRRLARALERHGRVVLPLLATAADGELVEVPPLPELVGAAAGLGHVMMPPDADGLLRRLPLWAGSIEPLFPALALETLALATPGLPSGQPAGVTVNRRNGAFAAGFRLVPLASLPPPEVVAAADVLAERAQPSRWRDRIVVVGVTAEGVADRVEVPKGLKVRGMSGVEVQARAVQALSSGAVATAAEPTTAAALGSGVAAVVAGLFAANRRSWALLAVGLVLPPATTLGVLAFAGLWVPPTGAMATALLCVAARQLGWRHYNRRLLTLERRRAATMLEVIETALLVVDGAERIRFVNGAAERLAGRPRAELEGRRLAEVVGEGAADACGFDTELIAPLTTPAGINLGLREDGAPPGLRLVRVASAGGEARIAQFSRARLIGGGDDEPGDVVALTDVTELARTRRELERLATHDLATELPNRQFINQHLPHALARVARQGSDLAVLLIDLDHFKEVNDRLGHQAGDRLLRAVARRLRRVCRSNDLVARIGGDEFVVVMDDLGDRRHAALLADKLLAAFREPVRIAERDVQVELSIGVSCASDQPGDADALLSRADTAMYAAKHRRGAFRLFSPELDAAARRELELREELRESLAERRFELHFQPRVDLRTVGITGFEALLRWRRRDGTPVSPGVFVPVAENAGLIEAITEWIIEDALAALEGWRRLTSTPLTVSVNVSARHFVDPGLGRTIERALATTALPPAALTLEITESMLMRDPPQAIEVMRALKAMGLQIAVDDFGTGYSSLAYLRDFPIDEIKIDKSFAARIGIDERDDLIVTAIARMAQSLRIEAVAEGVEQEAQAAFLRELDIRHAQGFLFSRPVPRAAADAFVTRGHTLPPDWARWR